MSFILIMSTDNWQEWMMKAKHSLRVSSRERLKLNHLKFMVTSPKCSFETLHPKSFLKSSTLGGVSFHATQQKCSWIPVTKPSVNLWSWECLRGCCVTFSADMGNPLPCPECRAASVRTASAKQELTSQSQTKKIHSCALIYSRAGHSFAGFICVAAFLLQSEEKLSF